MILAPAPAKTASAEALFRYCIVSDVLARELNGEKRPQAVRSAAKSWLDFNGKPRGVGKRSIYRWLAAFEGRAGNQQGLAALEPVVRKHTASSLVLPPTLLTFMAQQKSEDVAASIPELIRRARELGIVAHDECVDRSTAYRAARRMGLTTRRRKAAADRDSRRYAYPHRLDCVLCDGKFFRAGAERKRRVAYFFLDDATRTALHVVVGSSENEALFLRGLYELIRKYGYMGILYMDHGAGFIGLDTIEVVAGFPGNTLLVHGEKRYPEGHGKIERFNQTAKHQVLRHFDKRPDVDAECMALELRLSHYLGEQYNHTPHESLGNQTPWGRFVADPKPLRLPDSDAALRGQFVVHFERTQSNDHVVSIEGVYCELPRGCRDRKVRIHHRLLDGSYAVLHDGKLVDLKPVDLVDNARSRRAAPPRSAGDVVVERPLPPSAADLRFQRDFRPVVDDDGGFSDTHNKED